MALTHEDFWKQILAEYASNEPRLVYADWLDEQGDPRGEFIRAQCEHDQAELYSKQAYDCYENALSLLRQHRKKWIHGIGDNTPGFNIRFERGFPAAFHYAFAHNLLKAKKKLEQMPLLGLDLHKFGAKGDQVLGWEPLQTLSHLSVLYATQFTKLLGSGQLKGLKSLEMRRIEDAGAEFATAVAGLGASLERLIDGHGDYSAAAVQALEGAEFPNLTELDMCGRLIQVGALGCVNAPNLKKLRIRAERSHIRSSSKLDFGLADNLPYEHLESLDLNWFPNDVAPYEWLAERGAFNNVVHFSVFPYSHADHAWVDIVARGKHLKKCESLSVSGAQASAQILRHLPKKRLKALHVFNVNPKAYQVVLEHGSALRELTISGKVETNPLPNAEPWGRLSKSLRCLRFVNAQFCHEVLDSLTHIEFKKLTSLQLYDVKTSSVAELQGLIERLLDSRAFANLLELRIVDCNLPEELLLFIAQSDLPDLRFLDFSNNQQVTSADGPRAVLQSDALANLRRLRLANDHRRTIPEAKKLMKVYAGRLQTTKLDEAGFELPIHLPNERPL